jgi:hypothetical protein
MEILETINAAGGQLWLVDGERLRYRLPENLAPLVEVIRERKPEIVELLAQLPAMPAGARLVSWNPKAAPVQVNRYTTVTDVDLFICSTLRQLEAALEGRSWQSGNWGLAGLLARLEACGCIVELEDGRLVVQ